MTDKDFYRLQNQWSKIYYRDISQGDLDRVLWINRHTGMRGVHILELGAGGGQFSVAACQLNHKITAVEIEPDFVEHMRFLARHRNPENLTIINADFNNVEFESAFDVICYWDGFGLGSDSDQRQLLQKISSWLTPDGSVFLEIFTPWFWASKVKS
jgi:cyclopropane fatty-acyl-phospholipid synthase-like methyltransferase